MRMVIRNNSFLTYKLKTIMQLDVILSVLGSVGGLEAIKWGIQAWVNRENNRRIDDAHADQEEFNVLKDQIKFLQEDNMAKEQRFAEQTERLRKTQDELFASREELAKTNLELALKRCERKKCADRQPQNGY